MVGLVGWRLYRDDAALFGRMMSERPNMRSLLKPKKEWGSMGFVSVIIVSVLFALGLPLVLL